MRHQVALATAVLLSCLGAGCASTQAVRDSSANTAQLMRQVGPEVDRFRAALQAGDADIAAALTAARLKDEAARIWLNEQVRFDSAAGNTKRLAVYAQMKSVSDSLSADDEELLASKAKIEAEITGLLKPLPATGPNLSKAVDAILVLGQERSARAQFEESLAVWKAVIASTKENRDKLKKATKRP